MSESPPTPPRRRAGRPPKLNSEQRERLKQLALEHPLLSLPDLTRLFAEREGVKLSSRTVSKYLLDAGLKRTRGKQRRSSGAGASTAKVSKDSPRYSARHRDEGDLDRYPHGLTDAEWARVRDLFENRGPGRPPKHPRRLMLDACIYVLRSGCPWRMLPKDFPHWEAVYDTFRRWSDAGIFEEMHDRLRAMYREREHRAVEPTAAIVDAQAVRSSAQGGVKGFDAGKKIKGRKRHLVTDTLGLVLAVLITGANVQDRDAAEPVVQMAKEKYDTIRRGWVDAGYGGKALDAIRANLDVDLSVVRHPNNRNVGRWHDPQLPLPIDLAPSGFVVLPKRWIIERTNGWTDHCRRLQRSQDQRVDVEQGWFWLAHARLLLRRLTYDEPGPKASIKGNC